MPPHKPEGNRPDRSRPKNDPAKARRRPAEDEDDDDDDDATDEESAGSSRSSKDLSPQLEWSIIGGCAFLTLVTVIVALLF